MCWVVHGGKGWRTAARNTRWTGGGARGQEDETTRRVRIFILTAGASLTVIAGWMYDRVRSIVTQRFTATKAANGLGRWRTDTQRAAAIPNRRELRADRGWMDPGCRQRGRTQVKVRYPGDLPPDSRASLVSATRADRHRSSIAGSSFIQRSSVSRMKWVGQQESALSKSIPANASMSRQ